MEGHYGWGSDSANEGGTQTGGGEVAPTKSPTISSADVQAPGEDDADMGYRYARRNHKVYPITEGELSWLVWAPIWSRIALVRRMKREATF